MSQKNKNSQSKEIIGEAIRIENDVSNNRLFIVFEIKQEKFKKFIKENWINNDIEFKIIGNNLILDDE